MTFVCLWSERWRTAAAPLAELAAGLLELAPRVVADARGVIWADARGLNAPALAWSLLARLGDAQGQHVRAGVAALPVAAEAAARAGDAPVTLVEPGHERAFLAPHPLALVGAPPKLLLLLRGVGVERCGELAALEREAVEVRFGAEAVPLWRLARADDTRRLFRPISPERPQASLDFVDYAVRDARRLLFSANACLGGLCEALRERGARARVLELELSLAAGQTLRRELRVARPTAERVPWLRRLQRELDRLQLPDAVCGLALQVAAEDAAAAVQGDIFDAGFASAGAAEDALARLLDAHGPVLVEPRVEPHPLAERRTRWAPLEVVPDGGAGEDVRENSLLAPRSSLLGGGEERGDDPPRLALQLLPEPRRIAVRPRLRRDHQLPVAYLDVLRGGEWRALVTAAGPDRVSGGHWEDAAHAREYFRCVDEHGTLLWLYRDARENAWYLHGWWD
jgi:protein ImuB